jgi:hypothetical protein
MQTPPVAVEIGVRYSRLRIERGPNRATARRIVPGRCLPGAARLTAFITFCMTFDADIACCRKSAAQRPTASLTAARATAVPGAELSSRCALHAAFAGSVWNADTHNRLPQPPAVPYPPARYASPSYFRACAYCREELAGMPTQQRPVAR